MPVEGLHNPNRDSDAWLQTYLVCLKYKIDPE